MGDLKETEKNFFTCAILTILVGVALLIMGKNTTGVIFLTAGIVFAIIGVKMVMDRKREEKGDKKMGDKIDGNNKK